MSAVGEPSEPRRGSSRASLLRAVASRIRPPSDRAARRSREERARRRREALAAVEEGRREAREARERGARHAWIGLPQTGIDLGSELARLRGLRRRALFRRGVTLSSAVLSALLQAYAIQAFVQPAGLLSSGFTGLAILIDRVASQLGASFPTFAGMLALNVPVALLCWRRISRRFVVFSMVQVVCASMFLRFLSFAPIIREPMLEVVFGGFLYGFSVALALRGGASTAGTDFIALVVSNRTGRSIWGSVFAGNCVVLGVFGALFGWEAAAYSIVFQFISTKTIEMFYHRYDRLTLQVVTRRPDQILAAYNVVHKHGSAVMEVLGGRSRERYWLINTVVSSYELDDVVQLIRVEDGAAVVNVLRTESFFGDFYRPPIE